MAVDTASDGAGLRPEPGSIPDTPGSYQFKGRDGRIIYVGKAKSLRNRLNSYFQDPRNLHHRTAQMVATAASARRRNMGSRSKGSLISIFHFSPVSRRPSFQIRVPLAAPRQ